MKKQPIPVRQFSEVNNADCRVWTFLSRQTRLVAFRFFCNLFPLPVADRSQTKVTCKNWWFVQFFFKVSIKTHIYFFFEMCNVYFELHNLSLSERLPAELSRKVNKSGIVKPEKTIVPVLVLLSLPNDKTRFIF